MGSVELLAGDGGVETWRCNFSKAEQDAIRDAELAKGTKFDCIWFTWPRVRFFRGNKLVKAWELGKGYLPDVLGPGLYSLVPSDGKVPPDR